MAAATDKQVQTYVDERIRPRAEQIRALILALEDDKRLIDEVYAATTIGTPTWVDSRTDGPPHLLTPNDIPSYNSYITAAITNLKDAADYPTIARACVRPVQA